MSFRYYLICFVVVLDHTTVISWVKKTRTRNEIFTIISWVAAG